MGYKPTVGQEAYDLPVILKTIAAWEAHKAAWFESVKASGAEKPEDKQVEGYRNVWCAGFLAGADSE